MALYSGHSPGLISIYFAIGLKSESIGPTISICKVNLKISQKNFEKSR